MRSQDLWVQMLPPCLLDRGFPTRVEHVAQQGAQFSSPVMRAIVTALFRPPPVEKQVPHLSLAHSHFRQHGHTSAHETRKTTPDFLFESKRNAYPSGFGSGGSVAGERQGGGTYGGEVSTVRT